MARHSFAAVNVMVALIVAGLTFSVEKIGNGRAAESDSFAKNVLERAAEGFGLFGGESGAQLSGMDFSAPEAFIGVDVTDTAEEALIEQKGFDAGAAATKGGSEIGGGYFERVGTKTGEFVSEERFIEISHAAEATRIGVAEFAAVVEQHADVRVFFKRQVGRNGSKLTGHAEVDKK